MSESKSVKEKKRPWYENKPPKWLVVIGRYGWIVSIAISLTAIVIAIQTLTR